MTIALADSNLRTSQATKELLKEYIEMTQITALNLEEQIEELSAKLDLLQSEQHYPSSDIDSIQPTGESTTAKQTLDQKASLEQCLSVCQQLLVHIEEIKPSVFGNTESATGAESTRDLLEDVTVLAPRITANALEICTQNLNATARYLRDLQEGSQSKTKSDEARIMQQLDSAQMCLGIVKDAQQHRTNIFEKIDTAEDSRQIIVSTIGELIKANGLTIGARAINIMGQMNDESLQKIANNFPSTTPERSSSPETGVTFEKRHGFGHTIQRGRR